MSETTSEGAPSLQPPAGPSASLKHELRTPLNHVIGYCEMLLEEVEDRNLAAFRPDLEHIHTAGRHLLAVINDLFEPDKAPAYRTSPSLFDHEIRTPLNQIIGYAEMLQEEAQEGGQAGWAADLGKIHAAARQLLQRVVEHFGSTREEFAVAVSAVPSTATTFLRREPEAASGIDVTATDARAGERTGYILAVDDDAGNRDMLGRRLTRLGHTVHLAENGCEALELLRRHSFDVVLLDIQMPELNGYEVLDIIKADPALRHFPVIVLSASDETSRVAHAIELGAEDYLPKPFDPVLLQARIGACLEKKRLRDREVLHLRQIQEEQRRSDELLHIILPRDVAAEIKATSMVRPRRFEKVAVLFCDIVGFTAWCDRHSPEEVLLYLQGVVQAFEKLTSAHGMEKIKTIGDAYMATAGLLVPLPDPTLAAVRCGWAMIAAARELPPHWEVRVGIHSGPVIAGVVGREKYQYDVWGDTVNTAMRMAQAAAPGTVLVNADTWQFLSGSCRGLARGRLPIKGKGELELVQVETLNPERE